MYTCWKRGSRMRPIRCTISASRSHPQNSRSDYTRVAASEYMDSIHPRTWTRLRKVINRIRHTYSEIESVDIISCTPVMTRRGTMNGFELVFEIESLIEALDHLEINVQFTRPLSQVTADTLFDAFAREYQDYIDFKHISTN